MARGESALSTKGITLSRHILEEEKKCPVLTAELSELLFQISYSAKLLSREIGRAALVGRLGLVGENNPTSDAQKKLDVYAHETQAQPSLHQRPRSLRHPPQDRGALAKPIPSEG